LHPSSCSIIAHEILDSCIAGEAWSRDALRHLLEGAAGADPNLAQAGSSALFQVLVEGLADRFEPRLSDVYAEIFSQAVTFVKPASNSDELVARYRRVRRPRSFRGDAGRVRRVFVLSRVTLGADVAITSVMLDAAKRRFPEAEVFLAAVENSWKLFAADARLRWLPISYGRGGTLGERLAIWPVLSAALAQPDSLVIDPDSRLTQLGLLPVCPEEHYFFFESRSYGGDGQDSLTTLARRWVAEVFDVPDAAPYLAPAESPDVGAEPFITVNLGVGENPAKRVPDPFEEELLRALLQRDAPLVVDLGAGGEEEARVRRAVERSGAPASRVRLWRGSFAALAAMIAKSRLYVGYDSAGQHAAAVCGTPLVTIFAGFASPRMFARWSPTGPGPKEVIRVDTASPRAVLEQTLAAIDRLLPPTCTSRR
jgi:ADP-heptose:LPS heptosyltransferase